MPVLVEGAAEPCGCRTWLRRILRPYDGETTAEVYDYIDERTGVLASSLAKREPGYTSLGFPDPRRLPYTPSAQAASTA